MTAWSDREFINRDGLSLHYRDYDGPSDRPPVICLHGLTRNSRDFETVAARLAGDWRVITLDFRGRGESDSDKDPSRYVPGVYALDVIELLGLLGAGRAVFLGTSLGGIVTMLVASMEPRRIAGALLNDIGPDVDPAGIDRIRTYVGKPQQFADFAAAAAAFRSAYGDVHPSYEDDDWLRYARRVCREEAGSVVLDYDMRIADVFNRDDEEPVGDLWPYAVHLRGKPLTVLRGDTSDLLTVATADRLRDELGAEVVTVPGVGHAPDLDEPESRAAIDRLLGRVLDAHKKGATD